MYQLSHANTFKLEEYITVNKKMFVHGDNLLTKLIQQFISMTDNLSQVSYQGLLIVYLRC